MNARPIAYIERYFLKKGQSLAQINGTEEDIFGSAEVFHATTRYRKRVGRFDWANLSASDNTTEHIQSLGKLFHSSRVSKSADQLETLGITEERLQLLFKQGLLMRRTDYDKDGRTSLQMVYVAGIELHSRLEEERKGIEQAEWIQMRAQISSVDQALERLLIFNEKEVLASKQYNQPQQEAKQNLAALMRRMREERVGARNSINRESIASVEPILNPEWSLARRKAYINFLIAVTDIAVSRTRFDWKEIGARFYREIGGSKRFDAYKEEFLLTLETQLDRPLALLGLVSTGSLYSVYFAGQLSGEQGLFYPNGYVHALTDLTAFLINFQSDCRCLWLVENRAVLTRMAAEGNFLEQSASLVVGLDGQLRSAQKKLIRDLLQYSPGLDRIRVWCDYDNAGYHIADHIRRLVQEVGETNQAVSVTSDIRWIAANLSHSGVPEACDWNDYALKAKAYPDSPTEQEMEMGGVDDWNHWITD